MTFAALRLRLASHPGSPMSFQPIRVGGVPSRNLNLYSPGEMVGYFDELSASITVTVVTYPEVV